LKLSPARSKTEPLICHGFKEPPEHILEVGFQEQASNHSKLLRSRAVGSERWSKATGTYPEQVRIRRDERK